MRKLSKKEWVATVVALFIIIVTIVLPSFQIGITDAIFNLRESGRFNAEDTTELVVEDVVLGAGESAQAGDILIVHYTGSLIDGTIFDTSRDNREPFEFVLGEGHVISGWDQGLVGMQEGGLRLLLIPPHLGYGGSQRGPIPPNATLLFEVELLEIIR